MKQAPFLAVMVFGSLLSACGEGSKPESSVETASPTEENGAELSLVFAHTWNGEKPATEKAVLTTDQGQNIRLDEFRYIVSNVTLVREGGGEYIIPDSYGIINGLPGNRHVLKAGIGPEGTYTGIRFWVGLERKTNHQDPTKLPQAHPLNNPDMHWAWNPDAGYKFLAVKGEVALPPNLKAAPAKFLEWDIAEDTRFREVKALANTGFKILPGKPIQIDVAVDVAKAFAGLLIQEDNLVNHSTGAAQPFADSLAKRFPTWFVPLAEL